jgi:hypothetical protein
MKQRRKTRSSVDTAPEEKREKEETEQKSCLSDTKLGCRARREKNVYQDKFSASLRSEREEIDVQATRN